MKAYSLMDGIFSVDNSKKFVPFNPNTDNFSSLLHGSQVLGISPFLVITSSEIVLLDGGLGVKNEHNQSVLLQNLADLGYNPEDVTMVILSHLHKDHISGIGEINENGNVDFYFPNARLFYQKKEMEYAMNTDSHSFNKTFLQGLATLSNTQLLDGDGSITDEIQYFVTGGHTPYHQAIQIEGADKTIFFGADVAPLLFQMKHNIVGKYDYDGRKAADWRKKWWEKGQEEHWEFLFYHDYKHPIFEL